MYHIIIKKEIEQTRLTERQWTTVDYEILEDGSQKKVIDYTPQVEEKVMKEITILEQVTEELNLPLVIAAVNGLELK